MRKNIGKVIESLQKEMSMISLAVFLLSIYGATQGWMLLGIPTSVFMAIGMLVLMICFWVIFRDSWDRLWIIAIYTVLIAGIIYSFSSVYISNGFYNDKEPLSPIIPDRSDAVYFSIVTWTTLGYGDFQPSEASRGWAAFEALCGSFFSAIYIAFVFKFLTQKEQSA